MMKHGRNPWSQGFTLTEVIISILLLSILTVGSFKTYHLIQSTASTNLQRFNQLQLDSQQHTLEQIQKQYPQVSADDAFPQLQCLIEGGSSCTP